MVAYLPVRTNSLLCSIKDIPMEKLLTSLLALQHVEWVRLPHRKIICVIHKYTFESGWSCILER